jgi:aminopeptidase YwaD
MINREQLINKSAKYLDTLCIQIPERCVGSQGNHQATRFFQKHLDSYQWQIETHPFSAIDWIDGGASLKCGENSFQVLVSPYALGCDVKAQLLTACNVSELESQNAQDKIILLHGELAIEQLMPKNFVFYNPESHQKIIRLLEGSGALAFVCATGRNSGLAGGIYPFPLIEDGDFDIPSVYMTEEEGLRLLAYQNQVVHVQSNSTRVPSTGENVLGTKGNPQGKRIVITAHIDAKKEAPGAIDNGTGVVILMLLAELLKDYKGDHQIELVALNGEDYFCAPGQIQYIYKNKDNFQNMLLDINIDGAGYKEGGTTFSKFNLPPRLNKVCDQVIGQSEAISEGAPWPQSDHSIFVQQGVPAIAVTSQWFLENINSQTITHTPKDHPRIVNHEMVVETALGIYDFVSCLAE